MLSIENPMQPELDMGRNSFQMPKIRRAFEHALQLLSAALTNQDCDSYLSFFIRTDDPVLQDRNVNLLSTKSRMNQRFIEPGGRDVESGPAADDSDDEDNGAAASGEGEGDGGGDSDGGASAPSYEPDGDLSFSALADNDDYQEEDEDDEDDEDDEEQSKKKKRRVESLQGQGGNHQHDEDDKDEEGEEEEKQEEEDDMTDSRYLDHGKRGRSGW
jgi:hypothetical protein